MKRINIFYWPNLCPILCCCYAPAICNGGGGGHIASLLSVRTYRMSGPISTKNCFWAISFEYIGVHTQVYNHEIQVKFDDV